MRGADLRFSGLRFRVAYAFVVGEAAGGATSQRPLPAEAVTPAAGSGLTPFLPIMLVLPDAICGLWLMRNIGQTHVNPES